MCQTLRTTLPKAHTKHLSQSGTLKIFRYLILTERVPQSRLLTNLPFNITLHFQSGTATEVLTYFPIYASTTTMSSTEGWLWNLYEVLGLDLDVPSFTCIGVTGRNNSRCRCRLHPSLIEVARFILDCRARRIPLWDVLSCGSSDWHVSFYAKTISTKAMRRSSPRLKRSVFFKAG